MGEPFSIPRFPLLLWITIKVFVREDISRLGAALAFYTTVAVAPLLVLSIAAAGIFFASQDTARARVLGEIENLAGKQAGAAIQSVQNPSFSNAGHYATIIGAATLVFGDRHLHDLQTALNTIWHVRNRKETNRWRMVRNRLFSMAMVLATGFLLLVSLLVSAFLSWVVYAPSHTSACLRRFFRLSTTVFLSF